MRLAIFFLSFTLLVVTCQNKKENSRSNDTTYQRLDSLKTQHEDYRSTTDLRKFDMLLLQGVWWLDTNDVSALFKIEGDSLYYTEEMHSPYLIRVDGDSLWMIQENYERVYKIYTLTKDSLVLYDKSIDENILLIRKR
jgi:hypothetical protein